MPALHVAGTRGKGSTCALLSAALHAAGHRVGLATSPHLVSPTERIRIAERDLTGEQLLELVAEIRRVGADLEPSYFEVMAAAAFLAFAGTGCDAAVLEVGLGGRLDATNVCRPVVTAVTRLGLDHQDRLGTTLAEIAAEKAGIFKPDVPAIVSAANEAEALLEVRRVAAEVGAPLRLVGPEEPAPASGLVGEAQRENARLAAAVLDALRDTPIRVDARAMERGFAAVRWRGRLEELRWRGIDLLVDVAHDTVALRTVLEHLRRRERRPVAVLFSCLSDKPLDELSRLLAESPMLSGVPFVVPEIDSHRARPAAQVIAALTGAGLDAHRGGSVREGLERCVEIARGLERPLVVATGSFHVAGAVIALADDAESQADETQSPADDEPQ